MQDAAGDRVFLVDFPEAGRCAAIFAIVAVVKGPDSVPGGREDRATNNAKAEAKQDVEVSVANLGEVLIGETIDETLLDGLDVEDRDLAQGVGEVFGGEGIVIGAVHTPWFGVPLGLLVFAAVLVVLFGTRLGRWVIGLAVALAVVALATVGFAGPHFGSRTIHVASLDDLSSSYDYGAGALKLDLSGITSVTGAYRTEVHMGRGNVTVVVPAGVPVYVHARAGVGSVKVDGHRVSGIDAEQSVPLGSGGAAAQNRLVVDVTVGAGNITVR